MQTILEALRSVLGDPDFYHQLTSNSNPTWDYGAMIEYFVGALVLLVTVSFVFKFILRLVK